MRTKSRLNSEKMMENMEQKYGRKDKNMLCWIVKIWKIWKKKFEEWNDMENIERRVSWIVKRFEKYRRKQWKDRKKWKKCKLKMWNDLKNMEEK